MDKTAEIEALAEWLADQSWDNVDELAALIVTRKAAKDGATAAAEALADDIAKVVESWTGRPTPRVKSHEVVAWQYEADRHCLDCADKRFAGQWAAAGEAVDNEGNTVHPLFVDELSNIKYETIHIEHEQWHGLACGTCREVIDGTEGE